jgi:hypothetical protein
LKETKALLEQLKARASSVHGWRRSALADTPGAFDANEIRVDLLGQVDEQMLKDIGVSIGGQITREERAA